MLATDMLLSLPLAAPEHHLLGFLALMLLLALVSVRLQDIYQIMVPEARRVGLAAVPGMLWRKAMLTANGAIFLVLSADKVSKKQLKRAHADQVAGGSVEREVRLLFVRHGESVWNYAFNRGFGPSFLYRLARVVLRELYLLPFDDSAFIDSPLSDRGLEQCTALRRFLSQPCRDPTVQADFGSLTGSPGAPVALLVSSQLRRAVVTVVVALRDRLEKSGERIHLQSSCQEISRNFDTMALAPQYEAPPCLDLPDPTFGVLFDASANGGNKTLKTPGFARLHTFAKWASDRPESTLVVGGHSLWFRSFFQAFLPHASTHPAKSKKLVNCGVVGLTLQVLRDYHGGVHYRVKEDSIAVVYGGFASK